MVAEHHNPKRRNLLAESRLVAEYLAERYPGAQWFMNLRIGATGLMPGVDLTDPGIEQMVRRRNRYADAIVVTPAELVVIEGTMWLADQKVGQLQAYLLIVRDTPALAPYLGRPVIGELVTGQHDDAAEILCQRAGLRYVHYEPKWIDDFYAAYPHRRRRPSFLGRANDGSPTPIDSP